MQFNLHLQNRLFEVVGMGLNSVDFIGVVPEFPSINSKMKLLQFSMILVDGVSGERTILWDRDERLMYREGELKKNDICSGKILQLDGHDIRAAIRSAQWAKKEGIPTVIDIDKVEPLTGKLIRQIDFVVTSSRFPTLMTGIPDREKALVELQRQTSGFLCSTLGHEGAMALVNGEILYVKGFKIKAG